MILVDTSVWVDHFRHGDEELARLLLEGVVLTHPEVIEELACGHLLNREAILELLDALPKAETIRHSEFLEFVARHKLFGLGLGSVDIHLLASALLSHATLLTRDRSLHKAAKDLSLLPHRLD